MKLAIKNASSSKKVVISIIVLVIIFILALKSNSFNLFNDSTLDNNWRYTIENTSTSGGITVPDKIKNIDIGDSVIIEKKLPNLNLETPQLAIRSNLQRIKVYLEEEEIYSLDKEKTVLCIKEPRSQWIFISLPKNFQGKKLKIKYTSSYIGYSGNIGEIYLGNSNKNILTILKNHREEFLASIILFTTSIISIISYLSMTKIKRTYIDMLYIGLINLIYFLLVSSNNKALELFYNRGFPLDEIRFISILCLPIVCISFLVKGKEKGNSINLIINRNALMVYSIISLLLYFTVKLDLVYILFIYYVLILFTIINISFYLIRVVIIRNKCKSKMKEMMILGFLLLSSFSIIFDCDFKLYSMSMIATVFLTLFTIKYHQKVLKVFISIYDKEYERKMYKRLAFTDALTGVNNRLAFEGRMKNINGDLSKYLGTVIFLFDLNNLKKINDTFGHAAGDEYIKESIKIFNKVFKRYGDIYRVGGDEFVFVSNKDMDIEGTIKVLEKYLRLHYKVDDYKQISYGYKIINENDKDIYEVYSIADSEMYKIKALKKVNIKLVNEFI